jgi:hemoglobin-like flavoprotein
MNADLKLIRSTFRAISEDVDGFSIRFYRNLFTANPEVRGMFPEDMSAQRKKLTQTLAVAVGRLGEPELMIPMLRNLGARHVAYGVVAEQYPVVAEALISAMRDHLGGTFDEQAEAAWRVVLGWVAEHMMAGATELEINAA